MVKTGQITEESVTARLDTDLATPAEQARVERFLERLRARGRRPNTLAAYAADWLKLARWSRAVNAEAFDLRRMSGREAVEFRRHCLGLGQAPATVNRALIFLAEYGGWAATQGDLTERAAREFADVPKVPWQPLAPRGLTKPELRRFLKEVDLRGCARDKAVVYLLLYGGLRLGEVASLCLEDVAFSPRKGLLRLRSEWAKGSKERLVPLPAAARATLASYLTEREDCPGQLFRGERGPLGRSGITKIVQKYAHSAGVKLSPHTLRHCFAYRYLEHTANDLVGLAAILGHSNLNTTMGYTRKRIENLQSAVDDLEFV
ncbi:MAG TPA: tyrosine-type recombinase/integrase [Dehalococcoidia bacterium]|nr:tyrosine-type recombinase/integrase [Dehalococcoidia bacterium]